MTSKIIVNNIEPDAGISTVTFNGNIQGNIIKATTITGVSTAGITTAYITSINDGPLSGARNIIINGSMVVNQRGWTGAAGTSTSGSYTTDRFRIEHSHDGVVSVGQTTLTSGNAYADGFQNALILRVTTADTSLAAGQYQAIQQFVEGYNLQGIKKGTANALPVTLSFWVRGTTTGTYIAELRDNDNVRTVSQAYTINAVNTWEKKTLTFPADTTGVFDNDNNLSLYVSWWLAAGSSFTSGTLQTTWAAETTANRTVGQVNALGTVGDFWLTGVQLEVGTVATPFERRSYGQELVLCQRYYQKTKATFGVAATTSFMNFHAPLLVAMRAVPIVGKTSGSIKFGDMVSASFTSTSTPGVDSTYYLNEVCFSGGIGGFSGLTQYRVYRHEPDDNYPSMLTFSAEL